MLGWVKLPAYQTLCTQNIFSQFLEISVCSIHIYPFRRRSVLIQERLVEKDCHVYRFSTILDPIRPYKDCKCNDRRCRGPTHLFLSISIGCRTAVVTDISIFTIPANRHEKESAYIGNQGSLLRNFDSHFPRGCLWQIHKAERFHHL